jgi:hypothetical protein
MELTAALSGEAMAGVSWDDWQPARKNTGSVANRKRDLIA